jgi:hypothetical protein
MKFLDLGTPPTCVNDVAKVQELGFSLDHGLARYLCRMRAEVGHPDSGGAGQRLSAGGCKTVGSPSQAYSRSIRGGCR